MADVSMVITVDGVPYTIDPSDIDGVEWVAIKRATGMTPKAAFAAAQEADFEAIAGLLWVTRRRDEPQLTFEQVLKSLSFRALTAVGDEEPDPS